MATDNTPISSDSESAAKVAVRRLIDDVLNDKNVDLLDEICTPSMAAGTRRWIGPFLAAFPDVQMKTVALVGEGNTVVARLSCSGTHLGTWRDHPPTGRRFDDVDEVYFFLVSGARLSGGWGLEDTYSRLSQLGLV